MADWYYEQNGVQRGPLSEADLTTMLANHLLPPNTLVWTASLGSAWRPASQTRLEAAPQPVRPPPLPVAAALPPPLPAAKGVMLNPVHAEGLPEREPPHDDYAKWLAFTPLLGLAVDFVLFANGNDIANGHASWVTSVLFFLANSIFAMLDSRNVYRSWRNPHRKALAPFIFLTPIAYFWRRARITGSSFDYLWIWLACGVVYLIGFVVMAPDV
jgi:hypothetical protein